MMDCEKFRVYNRSCHTAFGVPYMLRSFRFQQVSLLFLLTIYAQNFMTLAFGESQNENTEAKKRLPNIVVIFMDDLGYADIGPFGARDFATPNIDQLATEGRRFTDFVTSSAVCSASRASLLTGCYHERVGIRGALGPKSRNGIHKDEMTLGELCKQKGYATACFGKWHLGLDKKFLPLQHGFDEYFGLPYSNDMWPYHPGVRHLPMEERVKRWPHLPLIEGNEIINAKMTPEDQKQLTTQYTEKSVDFINRNADKPFCLYLPHSMVHVPLYVSQNFQGKSGAGLFGDVMMEVDWSVGQIMQAIRRNGLENDTLVIFTSDNGPWLSYGNHAGSAKPLREGKGTMHEGGYRVPTIMWWPGKIPMNTTCDELCSTIDIVPTVAKLIDGKLPDHIVDGKVITDLMFNEGAESPHEAYFCYYENGQLQCVRDRRWKLQFPHRYRSMEGNPVGADGTPGKYKQLQIGLELYDLKNDVGETTNVYEQNPDVVSRLELAAEGARQDLGDSLTRRKGLGRRAAGKLD